MKIIDLLNKIARGEDVPKEIFYRNQWWKYNPNNDYEGTDWGGCLLNNVLINELTDEVEIIEEDNKIEKIEKTFNLYLIDSNIDSKSKDAINNIINELIKKVDELVDEINNLKRGEK